MQSKHETTREFEDLLRLALEADEAGVFRSTPADACSIMAKAQQEVAGETVVTTKSGSVLRFGRLVAPLAACVMIVVGISQMWPTNSGQPTMTSSQFANSTMMVDSVEKCSADFTLFQTCFTGPSLDGLTSDCKCADLDRDGDVDFADFGLMQRASAMSNG